MARGKRVGLLHLSEPLHRNALVATSFIVTLMIKRSRRTQNGVRPECGDLHFTRWRPLHSRTSVHFLSRRGSYSFDRYARGRASFRIFTRHSEMLLFNVDHLFHLPSRLSEIMWLQSFIRSGRHFTKRMNYIFNSKVGQYSVLKESQTVFR